MCRAAHSILFILPYREWRRLRRRAHQAQQRDQSEVCGLFATDDLGHLFPVFVANESKATGHFEFGRQASAAARRHIRACGGRYRGIFHSIPSANR